MPSTAVYGIPYLSSGDAPDIPLATQGIADEVETELIRVDAAITTINGSVTVVRKPSDTTRTSTTTVSADPSLTVAVAASSVYEVFAVVLVVSNTTPDFKSDWSTPASASGYYYATRWDTAQTGGGADVQKFSRAWNGGTVVGWSTNAPGTPDIIEYRGFLITAGTAGSLTLRWAQNTSDAANTTVKADSLLRIRKVA